MSFEVILIIIIAVCFIVGNLLILYLSSNFNIVKTKKTNNNDSNDLNNLSKPKRPSERPSERPPEN